MLPPPIYLVEGLQDAGLDPATTTITCVADVNQWLADVHQWVVAFQLRDHGGETSSCAITFCGSTLREDRPTESRDAVAAFILRMVTATTAPPAASS